MGRYYSFLTSDLYLSLLCCYQVSVDPFYYVSVLFYYHFIFQLFLSQNQIHFSISIVKSIAFLAKIPLILLLNRASQWKNQWKNVSNLFFFITKSNAFLFFYRKNNAFFVTWNKIYAKFVQNVTKFVVKVPKKKWFDNLPALLKLLYFLPLMTGHGCLVFTTAVRALGYTFIQNFVYHIYRNTINIDLKKF